MTRTFDRAITDTARIITSLQAHVASLEQQLTYQIEVVRTLAIAQARAEERARWMKIIERMAESHTGPVQAALWGVAEMLQRNIESVSVQTNSARRP